MRRWLYGALALLIAIIFVAVNSLAPTSNAIPGPTDPTPNASELEGNTQLQGIPGTDLRQVQERPLTNDPEEIVARVRLSDKLISEVSYEQITLTKDGTVWVDAQWVGESTRKPTSTPEWNQLALQVANRIAGDHTPNRAVVVRLHDQGDLKSEQVARSLGG